MLKSAAFFLLCASAAVLPAYEFDFSKLPAKTVLLPFGSRGQTAVQTVNPVTNRKALRLDWDSAKCSRLEAFFPGTPSIPEFDRMEGVIEFTLPQDSPVTRLNFRICDREGEVFQIFGTVSDPAGSGKRTMRYIVDPKTKIHSWIGRKNGKKNGKLDFPVRVYGFSLGYKPKSGPGHIFIDKISYTVQEKSVPVRASKIKCSLETGHPLHILLPEAAEKAKLHLRYSGKTAADFNVTVKVRGFGDEPVEYTVPERKYTFKPGVPLEIKIPAPPSAGVWYVSVQAADPAVKNDRIEWNGSFAVMTPAGLAPKYDHADFRFGICVHADWYRDPRIWENGALAMQTVGARYMRCGVSMFSMMPEEGVFKIGNQDRITDIYRKHGIERVVTIGYSARWALKDQTKIRDKRFMAYEPREDAWRSFVRNVFRHFKGRVFFYEMWNEIDMDGFCKFSAERYAELARIAAEELHNADPRAQLMSSGFALVNNHRKPDMHRNAMKLAGKYFKIHCFHGHNPFSGFAGMIDTELLPLRKQLKLTIPWYAHETALTSSGFGETVQAETLWKKLVFSWARGSVGYTWYNLINKGTKPGNPEHNYGMLTKEFQPKAVFVAYNTLTSLLGKPKTRFLRQLPAGKNVWAFEFQTPDGRVIAVWNEAYGERDLLLRTDAKHAEYVDIMGNITPAVRHGGLISVPAKKTPLALRLTGCNSVETAASPLILPETFSLIPGKKEQQLNLTLWNPERNPMQADIAIAFPAGIHANCTQIKTLIPQGKKIVKTVAVTTGPGFSFSPAGKYTVRFDCNFNGLKLSRRLPIRNLRTIPSDFSKAPDAVLDKREQVFARYDADPVNVDKVWKGPGDLSAKVFTAIRDNTLKLRLEVKDDIHKQPYPANLMWKGDSVQLFFNIPGQKGTWDFGISRNDSGKMLIWGFHAPAGFDAGKAAGQIRLDVTRRRTQTVYHADIPLSALGMDAAALRKPFQFNLLINDNDIGEREGWIHLSPGVGNVSDPQNWPWWIIR